MPILTYISYNRCIKRTYLCFSPIFQMTRRLLAYTFNRMSAHLNNTMKVNHYQKYVLYSFWSTFQFWIRLFEWFHKTGNRIKHEIFISNSKTFEFMINRITSPSIWTHFLYFVINYQISAIWTNCKTKNWWNILMQKKTYL